MRKRLKQLKTLEEKGEVYWCDIEDENYNPQAKRWFFEKRAIENKIFDFEERLRNGQHKKPPEKPTFIFR